MNGGSYSLAPMSASIRYLTLVLLAIPVILTGVAVIADQPMAMLPAALMAAVYLLVWLYFRPTRFELGVGELRIVWPVRRYALPLAEVDSVELLSGQEFRARHGWGMRVGAGGLWGGFGLLLTRAGTLRFYVSSLDGYLLIRSRSQRPLLITPERPDEFVAALRQQLGQTP